MKFCYIIFVLTLVSTLVYARKYESCRQPKYFQNLQFAPLSGLWHLIASYKHDFELTCDCYTTYFNPISDDTFEITNCCRWSTEKQECGFGLNNMTLIRPESREANFSYIRRGSSSAHQLWVLDTDYNNFLVVAGCDKVNGEELGILWVATRKSSVSKRLARKLKWIVKSHEYENESVLKQLNRKNMCKYW